MSRCKHDVSTWLLCDDCRADEIRNAVSAERDRCAKIVENCGDSCSECADDIRHTLKEG